jgi:MFS family permease
MTPSRRRAVLLTGGAAHFAHDGLSNALYVLFPLWVQEFGLTLTQVGLIKTAYSGAMAGLQVFAGFAAERTGGKAMLAAGTAVAGLAFLSLGFAGGFPALFLAVMLAGIASSTQHPVAAALVSGAYEGGARRAAVGAYNFAGDLGKMAVPPLLAVAAVAWGWRPGVVGLGAVAALFGVAVLFLLGRLDGARAGAAAAGDRARPSGWGIRDRAGFAVLSAVQIIDDGVRAAFLTFLPFLLIAKGAGVEVAGLALALTLAGGAAGKLACGFLAERFGIVRTVVATEVVTGGGILLLLALPPLAALVALPAIGAALNGTSSVLYGSVGDFVERDREARAFGLFYTVGSVATATAPLLFGWLSDMAGVAAAVAVIGLGVLLTLPLCPLLARRLAAAAVEAR